MRTVRRFGIVLPLEVAVFFAIYTWVPALRDQFVKEDHFVELASTLLFALAAILAVRTLRGGGAPRRRGLLILVAVLGTIGFLDELSFGQRLFGLDMPRFRGNELDGVHEIVPIAIGLARDLGDHLPLGPAIVAVLILLAAGAVLYREPLSRRVLALRRDPAFAMLAITGALLAAATVLDLHLFDFPESRFFEEVFELNAALALTGVVLAAREARVVRE